MNQRTISFYKWNVVSADAVVSFKSALVIIYSKTNNIFLIDKVFNLLASYISRPSSVFIEESSFLKLMSQFIRFGTCYICKQRAYGMSIKDVVSLEASQIAETQ